MNTLSSLKKWGVVGKQTAPRFIEALFSMQRIIFVGSRFFAGWV